MRFEGRGYWRDLQSCPCCNKGAPVIGCDDCFGQELLCEECTVRRHHRTPFHRIKVSMSPVLVYRFFLMQAFFGRGGPADLSSLKPSPHSIFSSCLGHTTPEAHAPLLTSTPSSLSTQMAFILSRSPSVVARSLQSTIVCSFYVRVSFLPPSSIHKPVLRLRLCASFTCSLCRESSQGTTSFTVWSS